MKPEYYAICAIFVLSGYFWGKIINKFFPLLHKVNTTALGVFIVFGLFQIITFLGVPNNWNVEIYRYTLIVFLAAGPVLCLCLWVSVLPHWNDLFALLFSVAVTTGICYLSSTMNTNNLYFDSTFYLSRVIDSSTASKMGFLLSSIGAPAQNIYSLYDYQGFYYLWGIVLRQYQQLFPTFESLSPMYIWTATMLYGMLLGNTIAMCIQTLLPKLSWKNVLLAILIFAFLSPYYVNYFNTTLAFFGNTYRTVLIGAVVLIAYSYYKDKENKYFLLLTALFLAGLSLSSSCFFLLVFLSVAFFFGLLFQKHHPKYYLGCFFALNLPLAVYMYLISKDYSSGAAIPHADLICLGYLIIIGLSFLWEKVPEKYKNPIKWTVISAYGLLLLGFVILSLKLANGEYGYSFFFEARSANDMILNYTNWDDKMDMVRNSVYWILLGCSLIRIKKNKSFKLYIICALLLFLNPLVSPFIATYATQVAYCRTFDLIVNPFCLVYIIWEFFECMKPKWVGMIGATAAVCIDSYCTFNTVTTPFNSILYKNEEGYSWETKVTEDQWDMYSFINQNVSKSDDNRPMFLSQDTSLKAYVSDISVYFSASEIRLTINNTDLDFSEPHAKAIAYFNPLAVTANETYNGYQPDYTQIRDVILSTNAQYVLMRYPMAVLDPKGWYVEAYKYADDICTEVYKNDSWILLKVEK